MVGPCAGFRSIGVSSNTMQAAFRSMDISSNTMQASFRSIDMSSNTMQAIPCLLLLEVLACLLILCKRFLVCCF